MLDDLHAADEPSLLLLRFVAREIAASRVLIVCAYRDVDPALGDPLSSALAELVREQAQRPHSRSPGSTRARRGRIRRALDGRRARGLSSSRHIHSETEGNPLFMAEVVRLLAEGGSGCTEPDAHLPLPASVRAVIGRRVGRLSEGCRDLLVLRVGEWAGSSVWTLSRSSAGSRPVELLDVLDEAMAERVIGDVPALARPASLRPTR